MSWALLWHFSTFPANCRDLGYPSLGRVEGNGGGEKGWSGELSDMLLVMQPIKEKLKQISAGSWNAPASLLTPLHP